MSDDLNNQQLESESSDDEQEKIIEGDILEELAKEPTSPEEELQSLRQEMAEAETKAQEYLDGWQRARAEFANYKKRVERDQASVRQMAAANIYKNYLEVVDDIERALKDRPEDDEGAAWAAGIELIYRKLLSNMEVDGITVMVTQDQFFDPNIHEAISSEDTEDFESGQIVEVLKNGYLVGDKVLRPALVRVAQ
jgi:molecular chaperone GrpE